MAELSTKDTRRFIHSLRVATGTALAAYDLSRSRTVAGGAQFLALAARSVGAFQFPEDGLQSADGLLRARLTRQSDGGAVLTLQAQGAVGLQTYAQRRAQLSLAEGLMLEGQFDRNGTWSLGLAPDELEEADLSRFSVTVIGPTP